MHRIILVSHCLRGALHSAERRADMAAIRATMARLRKDPAYAGAIITAPYLLHAEVNEDVARSRMAGIAGYHLLPHTEVLVASECQCDGTWAEIERARLGGQLVIYAYPRTLRSAA